LRELNGCCTPSDAALRRSSGRGLYWRPIMKISTTMATMAAPAIRALATVEVATTMPSAYPDACEGNQAPRFESQHGGAAAAVD
jgi:hypothetical protein